MIAIAVLVVSCTGGSEPPAENTRFTRVDSGYSGIDFSNRVESRPEWNIIDYMYFYNGAGVAAGDVNNDGLTDLFFTANQGANRLYFNQGALKFTDVSQPADIGPGEWSTGVVMADVNADGWLDIYVCQVSGYNGLPGHNELYINNQDGTFSEEAESYGLAFRGLSTHAAFFDYDNDGDLDLYLLNHSIHSVNSYGPSSIRNQQDQLAGDRLFRNELSEGKSTFTDITGEAGIFTSQIGYGLGVRIVDYNLDGWPDIYVSNDFHENDYLYENMQDGTFRERGETAMGHTSRYSMGNDAGDINNDRYPEIVTLDMLPADPAIIRKSVAEDRNEVSDIKSEYGYGSQTVRNNLQYNLADGTFSEIASFAGIYATDWSWAPLMNDLDNDGWKDIYITNGIAKRPNDLDYIQYFANSSGSDEELIASMPEVKISNFMFRNRGDLTFEDVTLDWGLLFPSFSHGSVQDDLDNDGDLDLVVSNVNDEVYVFENHTAERSGNHWVQFTLSDEGLNTFGIGSRIEVWQNGRVIQSDIANARGFMSSASPVAHLGLGTNEKIDSVVIYWGGDRAEALYNVSADVRHTIARGSGSHLTIHKNTPPYLPEVHMDTLAGFQVSENSDFRDYRRETLIPYNISQEGTAAAVGDVNGDGLDDIFVGAPHGKVPSLWLQQNDGTFEQQQNSVWQQQLQYEDDDAIFLDLENDGDSDLYIVSGGNQFMEGSFLLRDRILLNDGNGIFSMHMEFSPPALNGACVAASDFNNDGYTDLFVGSRSVPGSYGSSPSSVLFQNTGMGNLELVSDFECSGMVTDAAWEDMDEDGDADLVVVGDWMPVTIFVNNRGSFTAKPLENSEGWWRSVEITDLNNDGRPDILAGNMGTNIPLKASVNEPVTLLLGDFDGNGQTDPVIFHFKSGEEIPFASKDELDKQIPALKKIFTSYKAYAEATDLKARLRGMTDKPVIEKKAVAFDHLFFTNQGGLSFVSAPVEGMAQWTVINDMAVVGHNPQEVWFAGNSESGNTALGPVDAVSLLHSSWSDGRLETRRIPGVLSPSAIVKKVEVTDRNSDSARVLILVEGQSPLLISSPP